MEDSPILKRINELARKSKTTELTPDELKERDKLRKKYLENFRNNFKKDILDNIYILEEDGTKTKLTK